MDTINTKFTPMPWLVKTRGSPIIVRPDGIEIAKVYPKAGDFNRVGEGYCVPRHPLISDERTANTMLVAAAPEMFRALAWLAETMQDMGCECQQLDCARTALRHAGGIDVQYYIDRHG